jgi:hypothetical protein
MVDIRNACQARPVPIGAVAKASTLARVMVVALGAASPSRNEEISQA